MSEMRPTTVVVMIAALLGAVVVPVAGVTTPDQVIDRGLSSSTSPATTADDAPSPGGHLAATIGSHESRLSGSVETATFESMLATAETPRQRALLLASFRNELDEALATLRERQSETEAARKAGTIDRRTYQYRTARTAATARALGTMARLADAEVARLPPELAARYGLDGATFERYDAVSDRLRRDAHASLDRPTASVIGAGGNRSAGSYLVGDRDGGFDTDFDRALDEFERTPRNRSGDARSTTTPFGGANNDASGFNYTVGESFNYTFDDSYFAGNGTDFNYTVNGTDYNYTFEDNRSRLLGDNSTLSFGNNSSDDDPDSSD